MSRLPIHINCQNTEIDVCDYYMCLDICQNTCAYARDIGGVGVISEEDVGLTKRLNELKRECDDDGARAM